MTEQLKTEQPETGQLKYELIELEPHNIGLYLEQLLAVEREAFAEPWTRADYLEEAARPIAHLLALVEAAPDVRLLGYAGFWQVLDEADINNVAIAPNWRGLGLGRVLLRGLLERARLLGCKRAVLEVRPSNAPALALYRQLGFAECGRRSGYYQDNGEDALLLECILL